MSSSCLLAHSSPRSVKAAVDPQSGARSRAVVEAIVVGPESATPDPDASRAPSPLASLRRVVALALTMAAQLLTAHLSGVATVFVLARAAITPLLMIDVRPRMTRIAWKQEPSGCRQQTLTNRRRLRSPAH
jgi:hypothetical protein